MLLGVLAVGRAANTAARDATPAPASVGVTTEILGSGRPDAAPPNGLSPRELELLRLLAEGRSDREIAEALGLSHRTVTSYVRNILARLDVASRTASATHAVRHGLV